MTSLGSERGKEGAIGKRGFFFVRLNDTGNNVSVIQKEREV